MAKAMAPVAAQAIAQSATQHAPVVECLPGALGARILGLDLSRTLSDAEFAVVREAFLEHHLISMPAQSLTPEQWMNFSRRFGPLEPHVLEQYHHPDHPEIVVLSNVVENGKPLGIADGGSYWHSDCSYMANPSRATGLYSLEVPDEGGDTLYANLRKAYAEMPERLKARLNGLRAVHDYAYRNDMMAAQFGIRKPLTPRQRAATPPVSHPAVRRHPDTREPAVYVNPGFTTKFEGLPEAESQALLEEVFAHCLKEDFRLRYRWHKGDAVIWDNAALMHCATARELPPGRRRTLLRTIISGHAPD